MSTTAWITTLQFAGVNAIFALSIYASLWTGVLSLAPVFFGAVSAFTMGYLAGVFGFSPVVGLLIGLAVGAALGVVTAGLVLRLDSHYLAMATIAMVLIGRVLILNLPDYTGGAAGTLVPGELGTWVWLAVTLGLSAWVVARLAGSRFGLAADAVREDEAVAQTLAINPRRIQLVGFVISGALAGVAGVMQASFLQYIGPDTFYTHLGFVTLAAVVLGGAFHWAGPIVGAVVFTILPELLRQPMGEYDSLVTGILLVVIIIYVPRGLVDLRRLRLLRRGPRGADADGPGASTPAGTVPAGAEPEGVR
ncbi:branched-chain amino acid ABC transporter permease [Nocardioides campestrisoli]|uniref:branched-chain amino acid ABC transporter permease n=1 Tax=Nocardioides campestrisoli TaxID=2736757 RepID=UPI00163D3D60|nr:branched-chain amino acid ABC transporter permease [Nocardioides campestrisoli]